MIRDEICACPEARRPQRKKMPWVPIVMVIVTGLAVAHVTGLTEPLLPLSFGDSRNFGRPIGRLVGDWESDDDPMFSHVTYTLLQKSAGGTGFYIADDGRRPRMVTYHVDSEDPSGTELTAAEFVPAENLNLRVTYSVAKDGLTMTKEYDRHGVHVSSRYRYIGPPTQTVDNLRP